MQNALVIVATGGSLSLAMLGLAVRGVSRDTRLLRRVAAVTSMGPGRALAPTAENAPPRLQLVEAMLLCIGKDRDEVSQALRAADMVHPYSVVLFAALRLGATLAAGLITAGLLSRSGALHGVAKLYPIGASAAVFIAAKMALRSRVGARAQKINRELPFALDIMVLMLESGVSLDQCFRHLANWDAHAIPATQRVLAVLVDDLQKGMSYENALDRWADRMGINGAQELAALFRQTILHGTELAPALRTFIRETCEKRISNARELIGKKTTQMTIVMILFLLPALMIVIIGPAAVSVFDTLKGMAK